MVSRGIARLAWSVSRVSGPLRGRAAHTRTSPGGAEPVRALTVRLSVHFDQTHNPAKSERAK